MSEIERRASLEHQKATYGLTTAAVTPQDQAIAKNLLRDLMMFNNSLQAEMYKLRSDAAKGINIDHALYEKMFQVQNKYDYAMTGFKAFDEETEKRALKALSESIEDLMLYMNNGKH